MSMTKLACTTAPASNAAGLGRSALLIGTAAAALLSGSAVHAQSGAAAVGTPAEAQVDPNRRPADAADGRQQGEIVVTGTRLTGSGFSAPTPVTVVSGEQLQLAAPGSLSEGLNQLPEFRNSFVPASTGPLGSAGGGGAFLNLRGLSAKRNLVLLDGRRLPSTSVTGTVAGATDINVLPQLLVRRVDVVTGGASAAYGSDAVSGVINFILDSDLQGIKGTIQGGISERGDNASQRVGLAAGTAFAGGRGHFIASAEYFNNDGVVDYGSRKWARNGFAAIRTLAALPQTSPANPTRVIVPNVRPANASIAGLITSGPLAGNQFTAGGGIAPFPFGTLRTATTMAGGSTDPDLGQTFSAVPPNERINAFARASYEVADGWKVYAEGLYGRSEAKFRGLLSSFATHQPYTIFADNAYLRPVVRAALGTTPSFTVGRIDQDWGYHEEYSLYDIKRGVIGIDGKFGAFTLNAHYTHGESRHDFSSGGNANLVRLFDAVDAVVVPAGTPGLTAGTIVCRTTLGAPTNGCVPINVQGPNAATPQALNYILGKVALESKIKQDVVDVAISGSPFELWAGPVSIGVGATYRKESGSATADDISEAYNPAVPGTTAFKAGLTPVLSGNINRFPAPLRGQRGGWESTNPGGLAGGLNVKEVFGEIAVPLARDWTLAKSLELNGAIRYADYSTSGGVTSWKGGVTYEPFEGIRLRATRSRDVRAANIAELFQGITQNNPVIVDPFRNSESNVGAITRSFGNPALGPERGDTFTGGVVLQPGFLPGLNLSADYYRIKVSDTITQIGPQVIVDQCFQGNTSFCSLIQRDPSVTNGAIISVDNQFLNAGFTRSEGIDMEASYRLPFTTFSAQADGAVTLRAVVNHVMKLQTRVTGAVTTTENAGRVGALLPSGAGGGAKWGATFSANLEKGPFSLFVQERYIGGGVIDNTVDAEGNPNPRTAAENANPTGNGLVPNHIGSVWYTDATASVKILDDKFEMFVTVNNLFNRAPPIIPTYFFYGTIATNYQVYDVIGRTFTAGVRVRF
jgi:outer membrane receptor protein involved in Fe transport